MNNNYINNDIQDQMMFSVRRTIMYLMCLKEEGLTVFVQDIGQTIKKKMVIALQLGVSLDYYERFIDFDWILVNLVTSVM